MRVRSAVRRMCRDCYVVKKKRVVYIRCKTVKKHKQRQGFHTEAGVSAWEGEGQGSHAHGLGPCACCESGNGLSVASASRDSPEMAVGILASLPWLPAWASVPAATVATGVPQAAAAEAASLELPNGWVSKPAWPRAGGISGFSPLRMLGGWGESSAFGRTWWNRR